MPNKFAIDAGDPEMDEWLNSTAESSARWIAILSDGTEHHQDDGRPGTEENAWVRLQKKCRENNLHIVDIYLRFRSHIERKPEYRNADGYWFRFGAKAGFGVGVGKRKVTNSYLIGVIRNNVMTVDNWRIPELIILETDTRTIDRHDETAIWTNSRISRRTS